LDQSSNNVDIRALAQEVAAVLYQSTPKEYPSPDARGGQMAVQNHDDEADYARSLTSQTTGHPPPPNYRTAIGPSSGPSSSVGSPSKAQYP